MSFDMYDRWRVLGRSTDAAIEPDAGTPTRLFDRPLVRAALHVTIIRRWTHPRPPQQHQSLGPVGLPIPLARKANVLYRVYVPNDPRVDGGSRSRA